MVDPGTLAGPSAAEGLGEDSKVEQEYLTSEICEYLMSMSARRDDGQYQCMVCARYQRC
jgi:hypothetical protein